MTLGQSLISAGMIAFFGSLIAWSYTYQTKGYQTEDEFADRALVKFVTYAMVISLIAVIGGIILKVKGL